MRYERKDVNDGKQVVLKFISEDGDPVLDDDFIREVARKENLRAIEQPEFNDYCVNVLGKKNPKKVLILFDVYGRDNTESHWPGMMYLDTKGKGGVIADWTRGRTGKEWNGKYRFLFAPVA